MDESTSLIENFELYMSQNTKGVQVGVYSVAFVSLAVALRKIRPFSRFSRPNDVPNRFLTLRTQLYGTVDRIEPNGALLMIKHKPLIPILPSSGKTLPVKVSGITVNSHGVSWLQSIIAGNDVVFIPVFKEKNCVHCEVMLQQGTKKKIRVLNIGPALVQIGFGTVCPVEKTLADNPLYAYYYSQLRSAENRATKSRLGNWYYVQMTGEFAQKFLHYIAKLIKQIQRKTPHLVST